MSDEAFHSELEPVSAAMESTNGVGPHDDDAAAEPGTEADAPTAAAASGGDDASPDFLGRLADAMRQTVDSERSRVGEDIDRRRSDHLAAIQSRRETEVKRMRELAADDRQAIDRWADEERQRIQKERDERLSAVEADLATSLDEHGKTVDSEIERVEASIAAHRTDVEAFFASLGSESDPVRIAQLAGRRPPFPDLETVAAATAVTPASAESEGSEGVPVMAADEDSSTEPPPPDGDAQVPETAPEQELVTAAADGGDAPEVGAGVAVMDPIARLGLLKASDQAVETALPRAVPAGAWRPGTDAEPDRTTAHAGSTSGGGLNAIGWFRRKDDSGDR